MRLFIVNRCQHLGGIVDEADGRPLFECPLHHRCDLRKSTTCPDYTPIGVDIIEPIFDDEQILPPDPTPDPTLLACPHRRPEIVDHLTCNICGSRGQLVPVHACDIHGRCTLRQAITPQPSHTRVCLTCPDLPANADP